MSTTTFATVRLSSKGQLVIPRKLREKLHWEPGIELDIVLTNRGVTIHPPRTTAGKRLEDFRGCLQHAGSRIPDKALQSPVDYRRDWEDSESRSR
jgi:AbrB family looped-hinge helix DNA binding protein